MTIRNWAVLCALGAVVLGGSADAGTHWRKATCVGTDPKTDTIVRYEILHDLRTLVASGKLLTTVVRTAEIFDLKTSAMTGDSFVTQMKRDDIQLKTKDGRFVLRYQGEDGIQARDKVVNEMIDLKCEYQGRSVTSLYRDYLDRR